MSLTRSHSSGAPHVGHPWSARRYRVHGHTAPQSEHAKTALEQLRRTLGVRYPEARLIRGGSAVYALHDEVIVGVAWIEPELVEGRVVGVERFVGALAGRS